MFKVKIKFYDYGMDAENIVETILSQTELNNFIEQLNNRIMYKIIDIKTEELE